MKAYKISQYEEYGTPLILDNLSALPDLWGGIDDEEVGNKYIIEVVAMPKEEFDNLPEWGGF